MFHDEEIHPLLRVKVVDRGDVGMVQLGESERFLVKALSGALVGEQAGGQDFDGDFAVKVLIPAR
jgi:hypothetical protein